MLERAGIERADAFAAVSSGDNSNIIAARVARETLRHPAGRGADLRPRPRRGLPAAGHHHRRHGKWTADQVLRRLLPAGAEPDFRDPSGTIRVDQVPITETWSARGAELG